MDGIAKLAVIAEDMALEQDETLAAAPSAAYPSEYSLAGTPDCPGPASGRKGGNEAGSLPIHMAALPGGKRVPLLKSLLTSACERNCFYCPFRAGRDTRRVTFKPEELADLVVNLTHNRVIKGAFLELGDCRGRAAHPGPPAGCCRYPAP